MNLPLFAGFEEKPQPSPALPKVEYDFPSAPEGWNGIALVGEAPGAEEVRLGHPFVGRSGQLLDKILEKADITRRRCLVTNVFRFQPPGNKVDHFFISRRAAKQQGIEIAENLGQFGSAYCRGEFAGEIGHLAATFRKMKKAHPNMVIVALGRTPLWALTGENELLKKIGKPLPCRLLEGVEVIPTFHPSFILRGNWGRQDEWLGHFLTAKKYLQ
jgi:uracil-DNA glycosylase